MKLTIDGEDLSVRDVIELRETLRRAGHCAEVALQRADGSGLVALLDGGEAMLVCLAGPGHGHVGMTHVRRLRGLRAIAHYYLRGAMDPGLSWHGG